MTIVEIILAIVLCGVIVLASYLHLLYVQSLRFRPRGNTVSLKHFEQHIRPVLKFDNAEGLARYALLRQVALILLALDLVMLTLVSPHNDLAFVEPLVLTLTAMLLFAEMLPAILVARTTGEWFAPLGVFMRIAGLAVQPFFTLVRFASSVAELGVEEPQTNGVSTTTEDIEALLDAGEEEGLIGQEDRKLIQSVVEFGDKTVREVVTPRPRVLAIEENRTVEELRKLLIDNEYSRVPVYEGTIDNIKGLVHTRDTLDIDPSQTRTMRVRELSRPIALVPETKPINELLREMQDSNTQMSIVIDEYGHTAGLVTMEDLMEEIVGEIHDESDSRADVVEQPDHSFIVEGNLDLDRLEDLVGFRPADDFESTTIGGLICEQLGQVPAVGAKTQLDGIQIEVLAGDQKRISSVRVQRIPDETATETPAASAVQNQATQDRQEKT